MNRVPVIRIWSKDPAGERQLEATCAGKKPAFADKLTVTNGIQLLVRTLARTAATWDQLVLDYYSQEEAPTNSDQRD